ncbi:hypothetical protein Asppvi_002026 [Aspergillus pseudoviridinutans]|uniref:Uncharacterized protein n=1 Tax=Aspergillus pseudoviridinutans TaxID=1517512 RepID=A0A9P3BQN9_9EURO|nr:uncharacterized protein Asppvi_002026 [Aspergillus pseudoviridinutans]GIJ92748.1 hypothetical protein Asppvi_002026 [Aspergillus pseudoviridinutans]
MSPQLQGQKNFESGFSSVVSICEEKVHTHFNTARQRLQSVLQLLRSQSAVLQSEDSLARHFHVPFASDSIAERVGVLFDELRILKDENGEFDNDIRWIDILLAPTYEPMPQEDGSYHLRLEGRKGLIKLSKLDHDLVMTGMPRQLVHLLLHPSDVLAEKETMKRVAEELSLLNELASQIIDTNKDVLSRLAKRREALKQLGDQSSQPTYDKSAETDSNTPTNPSHRTTQKALPTTRPWTPEELDRLPQWYCGYKNLSRKTIVAQFQRDFGCRRSFGAIQSALYRTGYRNPRRRRRTQDTPSRQQTAIDPAPATEPSNNAPELAPIHTLKWRQPRHNNPPSRRRPRATSSSAASRTSAAQAPLTQERMEAMEAAGCISARATRLLPLRRWQLQRRSQTQQHSSTSTRNHHDQPSHQANDFNRKDLFTQHQRHMHAPWVIADRPDTTTEQEWQAFEASLEDVRARCWHEQCKLPQKSSCGFWTFSGPNSGSDRMDNVDGILSWKGS